MSLSFMPMYMTWRAATSSDTMRFSYAYSNDETTSISTANATSMTSTNSPSMSVSSSTYNKILLVLHEIEKSTQIN